MNFLDQKKPNSKPMKNVLFALIIFLLGSLKTNAQFNLKEKLNRKADNVAEDFLFGKKKKNKKKNSTSDESPANEESYEYESYDNSSDNNTGTEESLDDYEDQPVEWSSVKVDDVVHFSVLLALIPNNSRGFKLSEKPDGATVNFGGSSYSSGVKELKNGDQRVTMSLFDYKDVSSLYASSTQGFSYDTTEGKAESIKLEGYDGYYSEDYSSKEVSVMVFVKDRYICSVSGRGVSKDILMNMTGDIQLNKLP